MKVVVGRMRKQYEEKAKERQANRVQPPNEALAEQSAKRGVDADEANHRREQRDRPKPEDPSGNAIEHFIPRVG